MANNPRISKSSPRTIDRTVPLERLVRDQIRFLRGHDQPQDEDDLVQDVLVSVLKQLPQFNSRRGSLTGFVIQITRSTLINLARQQAADKRNPTRQPNRCQDRRAERFDDRPTPSEHAGLNELLILVQAAIAALPPDLASLARYLGEWTPAEIAEHQGVHRGTVYRRMAKIKERWKDTSLKDFLDP